MQDRYLYRAKRTDNGEWVEGSLITGVFFRLGQDIPYILCPDKADYDCFDDFTEENGIFEVDPSTICQCTESNDKNRKLIFDNDIMVAHLDDEFPEDVTYERVMWHNNGFYMQQIGSDDYELIDEFAQNNFEVCGNIFDHPELLEVGG